MKYIIYRWGLLWHSKNDFSPDHIIFKNTNPVMFRTRKKAREFANLEYGCIKTRKDLRAKPFEWRFPKVVRLSITIDTPPCKSQDGTPQTSGSCEDK